MGQEHIQHEFESLALRAAWQRERQERLAYDLHMHEVRKITVIFFVIGSLLVIFFTTRPALIGLVAMICGFGYMINFINKPSIAAEKNEII